MRIPLSRSANKCRRGQAMVESLLGVIFISLLFFGLFYLSHILLVKVFLGHAAARVARARAVGLNDFMCVKVANAALIPVSGEQLWGENPIQHKGEYLYSRNLEEARAVMDFENWHTMEVTPGDKSKVEMTFKVLDTTTTLENEAECESHYQDYMN